MSMDRQLKIDHPDYLKHIFFPQHTDHTPAPFYGTDIDFPVEDTVNLGCRLYSADKTAPIIIYFHGNGEIVPDYDDIADGYRYHGMNVLLVTYRGYGWSTGEPSVQNMYADANKLLPQAQEWLKLNNFSGPLFVMGRSLGSAPAIDLAMRNQTIFKGLIIESGFADTLPVLESLGIDCVKAGLIEENGFNNGKKIAAITLPTLILHGAADTLILPVNAEKLQAQSAARNKQFILIPRASHNTMIETGGDLYFQTIKRFIDSVSGNSDWRKRRRAFKNQEGK